MKTTNYSDLDALVTYGPEIPSVSIIWPLKFKATEQPELSKLLKLLGQVLHERLDNAFPTDMVNIIKQRYTKLASTVKLEPGDKGLAIYLSPHIATYYPLQFEPEEKIMIDENFEIRDLVYNKNIHRKYYLLLLSYDEMKFFSYTDNTLVNLKPDVPLRIEAFMENTLHDVDIYYEKSDRRDHAMYHFIRNADLGLDQILIQEKRPVFVMGTDKILNHFLKITKHQGLIKGTKEGNFMESSKAELALAIEPLKAEVLKNEEIETLHLLDEAMNKGLLASGIKKVWEQSALKNGRILCLEKNYRKLAYHDADHIHIHTQQADNTSFPIQDAVDDLIEQVIAQGGEIRFVESGKLGKYQRVALILYHLN